LSVGNLISQLHRNSVISLILAPVLREYRAGKYKGFDNSLMNKFLFTVNTFRDIISSAVFIENLQSSVAHLVLVFF
jgi:hypothetical protein